MPSYVKFFLLLLLGFSVASCKDDANPFVWDFSIAPAAFDTTSAPKTVIEPTFYYFEILPGTGHTASAIDPVKIKYVLRRKDTGKVVSSTYVNDNTLSTTVVLGSSWDAFSFTGFNTGDFVGLRRGVPGMKTGGKRTVILPPEFGIGFNTNYILDIELESIIQ